MILAKKPQREPDYQLEQIDDELLLYHPSRTKILYCNQTASLVWQLCDGQRSTQEIIDLLTAAYPEAKDSLPFDTEQTLEEFQEHGAIKFV